MAGRPSQSALTSGEGSSIFLRMSRSPASSERAALELALLGVAGHCVADILCR
ncbi:Ms4533A family Cys-rich leader peptide [Streptomyces sp. LamerLS-316]|uniref:Ms4533A family Cys-rich leader peptide n=1 Tax=Streptomyces sp. LamerLS-316 TaxID=1157630 RepID=UPI00406C75DC